MRLVIGGAHQGKKDWVIMNYHVNAADIIDAADIADIVDADCEAYGSIVALNHFHLLVRRWMEDEKDVWQEVEKLLNLNRDITIIADEIGCGIVPMDRVDRQWRELCGRVCIRLAKEATEVVRVYCGIGNRIK